MATANVRLSLEGDYASATTNRCRAVLEAHGFVRISTGSYTADGHVWDLLNGIAAVTNELVDANAAPLDHLWVQISRTYQDD